MSPSMMALMGSLFLAGLVIGGCAGGLAGLLACRLATSAERALPEQSGRAVSPVAHQVPSASVSADELSAAYANEVQAELRYKGHTLKVSGRLGAVSKIGEEIFAQLDGDKAGSVWCKFTMAEALRLPQLPRRVSIVGTCIGKEHIFPTLEICRFVDDQLIP
jgi:hypothetical protein